MRQIRKHILFLSNFAEWELTPYSVKNEILNFNLGIFDM